MKNLFISQVFSTKMFGRILFLSMVVMMSIVLSGCEKITPSGPNVYVCLTNGTHSDRAWERNCQLRFMSYVDGGDAHAGKNIVGLQKGTIQLNGDTYMCFSVPRKIWDIYIEWNYDNSSEWTNARYTVNLKDNDWVRISWDLAGSTEVDPGILQGSGSVY